LGDSSLRKYLDRWAGILEQQSIIETGWTAYHLAPVLQELFRDQFRCVVLHRDPISVALSRAVMGNYHRYTFYDDSHEVTPSDSRSIAPEYTAQWSAMNHFEKCLYWWWIVYLEAAEFCEHACKCPTMTVAARDLFNLSSMPELLSFCGLQVRELRPQEAPRNELPQFCRETFPVTNEWERYRHHERILAFAESLGYTYRPEQVRAMAQKYALPPGIGPRVRHKLQYWRLRSKVAKPVKRALRLFGR
jgi:hypothetical protein